MALSKDEREVVLELKDAGYNASEIKGFLGGNRLGKNSRVAQSLVGEQEKPSLLANDFGETVQDVGGVFSGFARRAGEAGKGIVDKAKAGKPLGAVSEFIGGIGRIIGGGAVDVAKIATSQETEDQIAGSLEQAGRKIAETGTAQDVKRWYDGLSPAQQEQVGNIGRFAEGLGEIAGVGVVAKGAKAGFQGTKQALSFPLRQADNVFKSSGVKAAGSSGISESLTLGINPESLMQRVARVSKGKQAKFEESAKQSVGEYLVDRDIFGTPDQIVDQLYKRMQTYKGRVDRNLSQIDGTYKNTAVKSALDELMERESKVSTIGARSADYNRIQELQKLHKTTGLSLSEVNEVKRLYERNVKLDYVRDNVSDGIARAKNIDSAIRDFVEKTASDQGFKNVAQLNRETRLARQLADDLGAEYAGAQGNNAITLTDWMLLAEASNSPTAAAGFFAKKIGGSKRVMSATARALAKNKGVQANVPVQKTDPSVNGYLEFLRSTDNVEDAGKNVARAQKLNEAEQQALMELEAQMLDIPDTGTAMTADGGMYRTTSFPSFIPKELRSKARFERVLKHIEEGTKPRANAGKDIEVYNIVRDEIRSRVNKQVEQPKTDLPEDVDGFDTLPTGITPEQGKSLQRLGERLNESSQSNVPDYLKNNKQAGFAALPISSKVTPEGVAKLMDDNVFDAFAVAIDDLPAARMNPDFNRVLDDMKLNRASDDELLKFLKETTTEYERLHPTRGTF